MKSPEHQSAIEALRTIRAAAQDLAIAYRTMGDVVRRAARILEECDAVLREPPATLMDDATANDPLAGGAPPVRRSDPGTSAAAAAAVEPRAGNQRGRVLHALYDEREAGVVPPGESRGVRGATAWEVERRTGMNTSSVSKRLGELERSGNIETRGVTRSTGRGGKGAVYYITVKGAAWCRANALV